METKGDNPEIEAEVATQPEVSGDNKTESVTTTTENIPNAENLIQSQNNTDKPKTKTHKKLLYISIITLLLLAGLFLIWYFYVNKNTQTNQQDKVVIETDVKTKAMDDTTDADTNPTETIPIEGSITQKLDTTINTTDVEVWLDKPVAIADQGYYTTGEYSIPSSYFQVGTRGDNTIILAETPTGTGGYNDDMFEKKPDGSVTAICLPSPNFEHTERSDSYCTYSLISNLQYTNSVHYASLAFPKQITLDDGVSVFKLPDYDMIGTMYNEPSDGTTDTFVTQANDSTLIKRESTNVETRLVSISYFLKTPINTTIRMEYIPLDMNLDKYQWQVGDSSDDSLSSMTYGCGGMMVSVTKSLDITDSDTQLVGTSGNGLEVYGFKDLSNSLMQKAYEEYKNMNSSDAFSIEDFSKQHGVLLFKDVYGQWLVYVRSRLAPIGGCAKPVIYLYPTKQQIVNVKVGATVKVSEPNYNPSQGWTALAQPNGSLMVGDHQYDSLFWEGPGWGQYPEITAGTIVKKQDAVSTIYKQLAQQGLNTKEANDFVDYWADKLPNKPYIRLTWFNTVQMDQLAPLYITPKPDTVIRVFLDASGLDSVIKIPAQDLTSITRKGFTVVEWGGLANFKLY